MQITWISAGVFGTHQRGGQRGLGLLAQLGGSPTSWQGAEAGAPSSALVQTVSCGTCSCLGNAASNKMFCFSPQTKRKRKQMLTTF